MKIVLKYLVIIIIIIGIKKRTLKKDLKIGTKEVWNSNTLNGLKCGKSGTQWKTSFYNKKKEI